MGASELRDQANCYFGAFSATLVLWGLSIEPKLFHASGLLLIAIAFFYAAARKRMAGTK